MTNVKSLDTAREARDIAEINTLHADIESSVQKAIRIGELLTQYHASVGYGNWGDWVGGNLKFSRQTAHTYMDAYKATLVKPLDNSPAPPTTIKQAAARAPRQRAAPKPKTYGWIGAMEAFSELPHQQWGGSQRRKIEKAGVTVPDNMTEDEARDFAAQADLCWAEQPPRETLTKAEESLVQKAIRQEVAQLRKTAAAEIQAEVDRRMVTVLADYNKWADEAKAEKAHYEAAAKHLEDWMGYDDFQSVISCLHPDRAPAGMEERYRKAFQIMNKLKSRFIRK